MSPEALTALVARTHAAPSVHNVQPARWRIEAGAVLLVEDMSRRLTIGDPSGNDAAISLGAAAEALRLAAGEAGFALAEDRTALPALAAPLRAVARYRLLPGGSADPLVALLERRASWRGDFVAPTPADREAAASLAASDVAAVTDPARLRDLGARFDRASYGFMRRTPFRDELRGWMRLSRRHPDWTRDGLNAEAMALGRVEAWGAGLVLGPLFALLDRLRLAPTLLAEGAKVAGAAGVLLFHRPADEDPFVSGQRFHRLWLEIEALGFGAAVLAALADDRSIAGHLLAENDIAPDHRLVSAFRIGRRTDPSQQRARLPLDEILV